jgi:hypothetical protein
MISFQCIRIILCEALDVIKTRPPGFYKVRQQLMGQKEARQMVDGKLVLVALRSRHVPAAHAASVVDKRVQLPVAYAIQLLFDQPRQPPDLREQRQIAAEEAEPRIRYKLQKAFFRRTARGFAAPQGYDAASLF